MVSWGSLQLDILLKPSQSHALIRISDFHREICFLQKVLGSVACCVENGSSLSIDLV